MPERIEKSAPQEREPVAEAPVVDPAVAEHGEEVKADIDELLDEIDGVLETNAEDFVRSYVQKGGQ